mgnify:CR=1 FL=1
MWLYHLFLFGLRRLLCDLRPDISIASISTAVHAPQKLEGGGPNFQQSTLFWYMFLNSKMLFRSGFVFSRIHTTELIFYQLLLSLDRSLKLIWIVSIICNFSFTLQRLWCTKFQLGSNAFVFPSTGHSVDMQDFFFLLQDCYKLFVFLFFFPLTKRGEIGRLPGEKFMFVCAIILLFENRFIFLACFATTSKLTCSEQRFGRLEVLNDQIESLPLAQGVSFSCVYLK